MAVQRTSANVGPEHSASKRRAESLSSAREVLGADSTQPPRPGTTRYASSSDGDARYGQVFDHVLGLALRRVYRVVSPAGATRKLLSF